MERIESWFTQDLSVPVKVRYIDGNVFSQDNYGNRIGVKIMKDGVESTVTGAISGTVIRSDGATVGVFGSSSGNSAWIDLPQTAYAVPGVISIVLKSTEDSRVTTLCAVVANVYRTSTDSIVDPGTIIPSIDALIAEIEEAVASIPPDYSDLWESLLTVKEMDDGLKTYSDLNYPSEKLTMSTSAEGYGLDGNGGYVTKQGYRLAKFQVSAGRAYFIRCFGITPGIWQWQNNSSVNNNHEYVIGTPSVSGANGVYIAPPGATWLILSEPMTESANAVYWLKDFDEVAYNAIRSGIITISKQDLVNGTTSGSSIVKSTTRVCTARTYKCYPGDVVDFTPGSNVDKLVIIRYDSSDNFVSELTSWLGQTEYELTEEGCYRFIFKNNSDTTIAPSQYDCVTKIRSCFSRANLLSERNECYDYVYKLNFERGDLYVNNSGQGTYYNSNSRLRTIKNHPVTLKKGDILSFINISYGGVFIVYKKTEGVYSTAKGWSSRDLLITEDGEYEILLRWQTETTINYPDALANNFIVKSRFGILHEKSNVENLVDTYKTEIEETIATATNKTTSRGLMFGIVTDTHLDNNRTAFYNQTMENLERLNNGLHFNGILHLGDMINGYNSADIAKYHLRYGVDRLLKIAPDKTYIIIGNHDNNNGAGDAERLTDTELYGIMQRFNEQYVVRTLPATSSIYENPTSDYYVDYPDFKIRMIMFDSCYYTQGFSPTTIAWVQSVFDSAPADYHFVLITHLSTEENLNAGYPITNAATFKALLAEYKDKIYCYIHGHTHYDYFGYPNEFADIALCSGVPDQPSSNVPSGGTQPSRTIGSVSQDCISVVIILPAEEKVEVVRFGAGNDFTVPFRESNGTE